jgi:hypothetical protein
MKPYDALNLLTSDKRDLTPEELSSYSVFVMNMLFGMSNRTCLYANEINLNKVNSLMSSKFYQGVLPNTSLRIKWIKNGKDDSDIASIREYYQCNKEEAIRIYDLIGKDGLKEIEEKLSTGGIKK